MSYKSGILRWSKSSSAAFVAFSALQLLSSSSVWADDGAWHNSLFYTNDTRYRGKDAQDESMGLSGERNIIQAEVRKSFLDAIEFSATLRATYNGVYQLNAGHYGNKEGGPIQLQTIAGGNVGTVPWGGGFQLPGVFYF